MYATLILLNKISPRMCPFCSRLWALTLQVVAIGHGKRISSIKESNGVILNIKHALNHCSHLFLAGLSVARN